MKLRNCECVNNRRQVFKEVSTDLAAARDRVQLKAAEDI